MLLVALVLMAQVVQPQATISEGRGLSEYVVGTPTGRNGYEEFVEASSLYSKEEFRLLSKELPPVGAKDWLDERRSLSDKCLEAFELIHQGAQKESWYPKRPVDFATVFGELTKLRTLAKAMTYRASVTCAEGHPDTAAETIADGLKMADAVTETSESLHYFVGTAITYTLLSEFDRDRRMFTPTGLKSILAALDFALSRPCLDKIMAFETAMMTASQDKMVNDPGPFFTEIGFKLTDDSRLGAWLGKSVTERKSMIAQYMALRKEADNALLKVLSGPESEWCSSKLQSIDTDVPVFRNLSTVPDIHLEAERLTVLRLARLHCLILQHRWQYGAWPINLDGVVPPKELIDPLTNKKFNFSLVGRVYELSADSPRGTRIDLVSHKRLDFGAKSSAGETPPRTTVVH